ncbi:protein of unknown function (plasmid) [Pararobbsia alpina]
MLPFDVAERGQWLVELARPIAARNDGVVSVSELRGIWLLHGGDAESLVKAIDYCLSHNLLTERGFAYVVSAMTRSA